MMKRRRFVMPVLMLAPMVIGCRGGCTCLQKPGAGLAMKGYELYSWQADGAWSFSLLVGTNRLKTYEEVTSAEVAVQGVEAIKAALGELPNGEQVFWSAKRVPDTALPPDEVINEIAAHCEQVGVVLAVDR